MPTPLVKLEEDARATSAAAVLASFPSAPLNQARFAPSIYGADGAACRAEGACNSSAGSIQPTQVHSSGFDAHVASHNVREEDDEDLIDEDEVGGDEGSGEQQDSNLTNYSDRTVAHALSPTSVAARGRDEAMPEPDDEDDGDLVDEDQLDSSSEPCESEDCSKSKTAQLMKPIGPLSQPRLLPVPVKAGNMAPCYLHCERQGGNKELSQIGGKAPDVKSMSENTTDTLPPVPTATNSNALIKPAALKLASQPRHATTKVEPDYRWLAPVDGRVHKRNSSTKQKIVVKEVPSGLNLDTNVQIKTGEAPSGACGHLPRPKKWPKMPLPFVLYDLLMEEKYPTIIDWDDEGKGFVVPNIDQFCNVVMKEYFGGIKLRSFKRQLSRYNFAREGRSGKCTLSFRASHRDLVKGDRQRCARICMGYRGKEKEWYV